MSPQQSATLDIDRLNELIREAANHVQAGGISIYNDLQAVKLRYLNKKPINAGGAKRILRTHDATTGRPVAMAVLLDEEDSPEAVENFLREARITAYLEHPNIVPVYDIGLDENGRPFFTMKLLSGENLRSIFRKLKAGDETMRKNYPRPALLDIFQKVCEAVAYAHSCGVVHLDLKPGNIQVNKYGDVLIYDWGLSKITNSDCASESSLLDDSSLYNSCVNYLTVDGFFKGTPGYMAPEQARGGQRAKDERTDIYSLGCILYTMLTYEAPIEEGELADMIRHTREGNFKRPRSRKPEMEIPGSLEAVVLKAMALKRRQRYSSVNSMLDDVKAYRNGFATRAEEAGFGRQLRLLVRRNPKNAALVLASTILITVITMFYTSRLRKSEREAHTALAKFKEANLWRVNKEAAPDYFNRAQQNFDEGRTTAALQQVNMSLDFDRSALRAWELKGHVHFARMEFAQAADALRKAQDEAATEWAVFAERFEGLRTRAKLISEADRHRTDFSVLSVLEMLQRLGPKRKSRTGQNLIDRYRQSGIPLSEKLRLAKGLLLLDNGTRPITWRVTEIEDGIQLDISRSSGNLNLRHLVGLPITELNASYNALRGVEGLSELPLRRLDLSNTTGIGTLDVLAGTQLDDLDVGNSVFSKISSLAGIRIGRLDLVGIPRLSSRDLNYILEHVEVDTLILSPDQVGSMELQSKIQKEITLIFESEDLD